MRQLNLVCYLFALVALFVASGCVSSSTPGGWQSAGAPQNAQMPPGNLRESTVIPPPTAENVNSEALSAPAPALPEVKVGLLLPLSGTHGALGQSMLQAAQMALFDIGHVNFELLPRDTKGTAEGARQAAQSVLAEGAQLILGPVFSEDVKVVAPLAQAAGVNVIAFSTDWLQTGENIFLMGFMPFDQIERVAAYASAQNIKRVGILAPDTEYGRAVTGAWRNAASRYRLQTAQTGYFVPGSDNLQPAVRAFTQYDERLARAGLKEGQTDGLLQQTPPFDAVLMPAGGEDAVTISTLLSHYGLPPSTVKRLGTGLLDDPGLAGEASLDGAWFAAPSPRLRASFETRFLKTYTYPAPRLATLSYDATALAAVLAQRGLKANGQPAFDRASITNPNGFFGIDGIFRFRPGGTAERGLAILELRRGKSAIVDDAPQTFQRSAAY
jgi:ABC-type branched-subunit amino acid transport system substrate-binding protein